MRISDWSSDVCSSDLIFLVVVFQDTVIHLRLIDEVAAQSGLAEARPCLVIGIGNLRHTDIGLNAAFLHCPARRRVIARRGKPKSRRIAEWKPRLHIALAKETGRDSCRKECVSTC